MFQGRFKSVLLLEERALDEVGRYVHLNPVRIAGSGLSKRDQQRARVVGCPDPRRELVSRRVAELGEYPWSSWGVYAGLEPAAKWLCRDWLHEIPGLGYSAAAQGIRRFWSQLPKDPKKESFRHALLARMSKVKI